MLTQKLSSFLALVQTFGVNALNSCTMTCDPSYESRVRTTLAAFHPHLSKGEYADNGPMVSLGMQWNVNGQLLVSRQSFVSHLTGFNTTFHGLQAPDVYHIVDDNVGAILYHLQGTQSGPVGDIPLTGRRVELMGGELMVFDNDALLDSLITIEEMGRLRQQLTGVLNVTGDFPVVKLADNPPSSPAFRENLRQIMASLHRNFNKKNNTKNADLAHPNVLINTNYAISDGRDAFANLFTIGTDAFPNLVYHDDHILADGHHGSIEYVWEGLQEGPYTDLDGKLWSPSGKSVRVRGMLFVEFDDDASITKVTSVFDEAVIAAQLQTGSLYP
jgi:predicted ester cyclase